MVRRPPPARPQRRKPDVARVKELREWAAEDLIECAGDMGRWLSAVPVSQIRKFLGAVNRIAVEVQTEDGDGLRDRVLFLKPRLAYVAARADANVRRGDPPRVGALVEDVGVLIDRVFTPADFRRLHEYVQGVVAYHRFYGGRE